MTTARVWFTSRSRPRTGGTGVTWVGRSVALRPKSVFARHCRRPPPLREPLPSLPPSSSPSAWATSRAAAAATTSSTATATSTATSVATAATAPPHPNRVHTHASSHPATTATAASTATARRQPRPRPPSRLGPQRRLRPWPRTRPQLRRSPFHGDGPPPRPRPREGGAAPPPRTRRRRTRPRKARPGPPPGSLPAAAGRGRGHLALLVPRRGAGRGGTEHGATPASTVDGSVSSSPVATSSSRAGCWLSVVSCQRVLGERDSALSTFNIRNVSYCTHCCQIGITSNEPNASKMTKTFGEGAFRGRNILLGGQLFCRQLHMNKLVFLEGVLVS